MNLTSAAHGADAAMVAAPAAGTAMLPGIGVRVVDAPKKSAAPVRASWARKE